MNVRLRAVRHVAPRRTARSVNTLRGVATGWTGVDMSTPLLPEGVPEIDADPLSLDGRCGERIEG